MVNNVIGMVNYVIAARPSLLNFMIAGSQRTAGVSWTNSRTQPCPLIFIASRIVCLFTRTQMGLSSMRLRHGQSSQ
jgi:hypothetical protein